MITSEVLLLFAVLSPIILFIVGIAFIDPDKLEKKRKVSKMLPDRKPLWSYTKVEPPDVSDDEFIDAAHRLFGISKEVLRRKLAFTKEKIKKKAKDEKTGVEKPETSSLENSSWYQNWIGNIKGSEVAPETKSYPESDLPKPKKNKDGFTVLPKIDFMPEQRLLLQSTEIAINLPTNSEEISSWLDRAQEKKQIFDKAVSLLLNAQHRMLEAATPPDDQSGLR